MNFQQKVINVILKKYKSWDNFLKEYYKDFHNKEMKIFSDDESYIIRVKGHCNLYIQVKDLEGSWVELYMYSDH
jgi:hypothetical protein